MQQLPSSLVPSLAALDIQNVSKSFKQNKQQLQVLDSISLQVQTREFVSIVGPSGSGKSTLFHLIGGLISPDQGQIRLYDQDITGQKGHVSYVPQQPALFPWRTIEDNVILALEVAGLPTKEAKREAIPWLERAGLADFRKAYPQTLSGGMQQRVAFLRGLISRQELMLLDEPFSALDALTRSDMQRWLLDIWENHRRSVLFITHNIEEALLLSDSIYLFSSRPARLIQHIQVPFARPRREEMIDDSEFRYLKKELSLLLKDEQQKEMTGHTHKDVP